MKVNNEVEKRWYDEMVPLLKEFVLENFDEWLKCVGDIEYEEAKTHYVHELLDFVLRDRATIDNSTQEFTFDDDDFVTGCCIKCGAYTKGLGDFCDYLTPTYYEKLMSKESLDNWICDECYEKSLMEEDEALMEEDEE